MLDVTAAQGIETMSRYEMNDLTHEHQPRQRLSHIDVASFQNDKRGTHLQRDMPHDDPNASVAPPSLLVAAMCRSIGAVISRSSPWSCPPQPSKPHGRGSNDDEGLRMTEACQMR